MDEIDQSPDDEDEEVDDAELAGVALDDVEAPPSELFDPEVPEPDESDEDDEPPPSDPEVVLDDELDAGVVLEVLERLSVL